MRDRISRRQFLLTEAIAAASLACPASARTAAPFADLSRKLAGSLIVRGNAGYRQARRIFNGRFEAFPAAVAFCAGEADVQRCIAFARNYALPISVRSGGHDNGGYSTCNDGLIIDLTGIDHVRLNPSSQSADVGMGVKIGPLYDKLWAHGVTTTAGTCPSVGIGGLALGGGIGPLVCKYGLTCDNVISASVITANGSLLHASADENADLFWAIRGGGGNFGIVTKIELRIFRVPRVLHGSLVYPSSRCRDVFRFYRDFLKSAPDELTTGLSFNSYADSPSQLTLSFCYTGDLAKGERIASALMSFGKPEASTLQMQSPPRAFIESAGPPGIPSFQTGAFFRDLSDGLIETICASIAAAPPSAEFGFDDLRGASTTGNSAFPIRDRGLSAWMSADWARGTDGSAARAWVKHTREATALFARGVYVNRLNEDDRSRDRAGYGASYDRLAMIKAKYDPQNVFRLNQNIPPAI
ncbi:MAG: FAD-binding oxidoreductase [Methylovirgula sp.]